MSKKKINGRINTKIGGNPRIFLLYANPSSQNRYPIIWNITLSYNLGGTLCLPIFAKGNNKLSFIHYGKVSKSKPTREAIYNYCQNFINYYFFHIDMNFEK